MNASRKGPRNQKEFRKKSHDESLAVLEVVLEMDADGLDAFTVFQHVRERYPRVFFFETAPDPRRGPERTVIGIEPEPVTLEELERLLTEQQVKQAEQASPQDAGGVPYAAGGVFGCIGYDRVREFEPRLKRSGYFQAGLNQGGSNRDESDVELLFTRRLIVFEHSRQRIYLIQPSLVPVDETDSIRDLIVGRRSTLEPMPFAGKRHDRRDQQDRRDRTDVRKGADLEPDRLTVMFGREGYLEGVRKLKQHILAGDIFQAVLAERFECELRAPVIEVFRHLRRLQNSPYSFFFDFARRTFMGASPEALIKIASGRIETHPIAGTKPRGASEREDEIQARRLQQSVKESAEHLMLVDLARNDLGRVSRPGTVRVSEFRAIMRLPNVMHLVSKVEAELVSGSSPLKALKACFPAGTLSGAPKIRAMELLSELEPVPRGLYGGAVVAFDLRRGDLDSCIAIRAMETHDGRAILRAGAGIVADSVPEAEYAEVQQKLRVLRQAIASAEEEAEKKAEATRKGVVL